MAGRLVLVQEIGVRVPVPEHNKKRGSALLSFFVLYYLYDWDENRRRQFLKNGVTIIY